MLLKGNDMVAVDRTFRLIDGETYLEMITEWCNHTFEESYLLSLQILLQKAATLSEFPETEVLCEVVK